VTEQCTVHNDAMEGHQCHGDKGHSALHFIKFDDGTSEWGDNDELWDEIDRLRGAVISGENWFHKAMEAREQRNRLRTVIENAPHAVDCCHLDEDVIEPAVNRISPNAHCTCWKAEAL
jgi:hypothetical protein